MCVEQGAPETHGGISAFAVVVVICAYRPGPEQSKEHTKNVPTKPYVSVFEYMFLCVNICTTSHSMMMIGAVFFMKGSLLRQAGGSSKPYACKRMNEERLHQRGTEE